MRARAAVAALARTRRWPRRRNDGYHCRPTYRWMQSALPFLEYFSSSVEAFCVLRITRDSLSTHGRKATGPAERDAASAMLGGLRLTARRKITAAENAYDTRTRRGVR